jgi:hypothetical protein
MAGFTFMVNGWLLFGINIPENFGGRGAGCNLPLRQLPREARGSRRRFGGGLASADK